MQGFTGGSVVKNLPANARDAGLMPGTKDPLEKEMATHSVFLPGKFHEQRSLYSPMAIVHGVTKELDTT